MRLRLAPWASTLVSTAGLRLATLPITAGLSVVTAAVAVRHTGADAYGYVSLVAQITFLLPFADLGLGAAVTRSVARCSAGVEPWRDAFSLIRRSALILSGIGSVGILVVIGCGLGGVWSALFAAPSRYSHDVDLTTTLTLSIFFALLPLALGQRVLIGQGRAGLLVVLGLIPPLGNLFFVLCAGALGAPPMTLALGTACGSIVTVVAFASFALVPRLGGIWSHSSDPGSARNVTSRVLMSAAPMLIAALGMAATVQSGRLVLASVATPRELTEYSLAFQLYLPLYSVLYMASTVLWSKFAVQLDRRAWIGAILTLTLLGLFAGLGFVFVGPLLVELISSGTVRLSLPVAASFGVLLLVQGFHATQAMLLTTPRGLWVQATGSVLAGLLTIPLSILLSGQVGVAGPSWSAAAAITALLAIPSVFVARARVLREKGAEQPAVDMP